jgi:hypothetical protein
VGADAHQQRCCRCQSFKPLAEFNFKNRAQDRRHPFCRECQHAWNRQHYERNRPTYIANAHRNNARYQAENLRRLVEYLLAHPCIDCGEGDVLVLEFDHRDAATKRMAVSSLMRYSTWSVIETEIAKCDVRCANCHRRRTARQRGYGKIALAAVLV